MTLFIKTVEFWTFHYSIIQMHLCI